MNSKKIGELIVVVFTIFFLLPQKSFASEPMFSIYPEGGIIENSSDGFKVDILLDSGGYDITKARFTLTFDPTVLQLKEASKNNSLFEEWPTDESSLDNSEGVVMLTGFTQSGSGELYNSDGDSDVMARLEFEVVSDSEEDDVVLTFEYSGIDELFSSVIVKDGSPPQNVLMTQPDSATFTLGEYVHPGTAIDSTYMGIFSGIVLIGIGVFLTSTRRPVLRKKKGTVVLYE